MDANTAAAHAPVYILNPRPDLGGIRATFGCSCGAAPKKGAARQTSMATWYLRHARTHGVAYDDTAPAIYAPGYAGAGMTFDEWHAANPGKDPFTGDAR